ncbi:MAG: terpene cyclase/mutase family protein [Planctomycetaceae bacterium]|nr:terpene cyclase/mutase family protein [Planctomycetaceae bacterium]
MDTCKFDKTADNELYWKLLYQSAMKKSRLYRSVTVFFYVFALSVCNDCYAQVNEENLQKTVAKGLDWLAENQSRRGNWDANGMYPSAMTGMAGVALLSEGSTATQGKYAPHIRCAIDFLVKRSRSNGLIGDDKDDRYTYGHGFGLLFLSQVFGEEEDEARRQQLMDVMTKAVKFCGQAQTKAGGWGYVSAKDGSDFDEGSTTITQVQALRGCRNAGIPVPKEIIDNAVKYIHRCSIRKGADGVQYNIHGGGGRPPISAAAVACLFNAGEYDDVFVPNLLKYCERTLGNTSNPNDGHWHYAHYYYAQVMYRQGGKIWEDYRNKLFKRLINEASSDGSWSQGYIGKVYTTSIILTILQLENGTLPIYTR